VLSEIGTDMDRWPSEKHFGSWLGLAPCLKKSGGKVLGSGTRAGVNRAAQALRLGARNLQRSKSALGAFFRRVASRRGVPKAITATAYLNCRRNPGNSSGEKCPVLQGLDDFLKLRHGGGVGLNGGRECGPLQDLNHVAQGELAVPFAHPRTQLLCLG
jgi:Transposase IS116/IS110/IS902 family